MLRRILITAIATVTFVSVLTTVVGADLANPDEYHSPFEGYEALVPGQPASVLNHFPCSYISLAPYVLDESLYCQIRPEKGPIRMIGIVLRDYVIDHVSYTLDNVALADLVERWDRPDDIRYQARIYVACWDEGMIATLATPGVFTLRADVRFVSIYNPATVRARAEPSAVSLREFLCTPRY
jgi:hypothetical protein